MRVTIHHGITLPGPSEYSSVRTDVTFTDIDPEGDVVEQIESCIAALTPMDERAQEVLGDQATNLTGLNFEGIGLGLKFETFAKKMRAWAKGVDDNIQTLESRLPGVEVTKTTKKKAK